MEITGMLDDVAKSNPEDIEEARDLPLSLQGFLKKDIPPLEYYVKGLLPKQGKAMISAQANIGKSLFVQNLALNMTSGAPKFLEKFEVAPARVLYFDLEMGEPALKQRFQTMCSNGTGEQSLFVKYLPTVDFLDPNFQRVLERWLEELDINVLIIDPLGNAWHGDENDKQQVSSLATYLNTLIAKYGFSVIVVHHWRKASKDFQSGGEMAAGSYKWNAWLDCHVTLAGAPECITINCEKNRHGSRFKPFLARINPETLKFEFIADFEKKYTEQTLLKLFNDFNADRVAIPQLIKNAEEKKICSAKTIRGLIAGSTAFDIDKTGKTHYLVKKLDEEDFFSEKQSL